MKNKIKKLIGALAVRAYDRVLVRCMPQTFVSRDEVEKLRQSLEKNKIKIEMLTSKMSEVVPKLRCRKEQFSKYPMKVEICEYYYYDELNNKTFLKYTTNLPFLVKKPLGKINYTTKLKIKYTNSLYRLMTNACSSAEERITNHGYSLEDTVSLQEAVCAIYRCNDHDTDKELYKYMKEIDYAFVCNDCYNCDCLVRDECKIYLEDLRCYPKLR